MQRHSSLLSSHSSLVTRHSSLVIAALAAFAASAAPVYLKAGATGANNGTSWTDAYTSVDSAVTAALAGDGVIYAAGGLYTLTAPFSISTSFSIYGGFAGQSMDETPATRDTSAHPTVFSGDTDGDDHWIHYAPDAGYSLTEENLTANLVIGPSGVNMPPAFTGEYDGYRAKIKSTNVAGAFLFTGDGPVVVDGIVFAGFKVTNGNSSGAQNAVVAIQCLQATVNDCDFIGNETALGCIATFTGTRIVSDVLVSNCRLMFNWSTSAASAITSYNKVVPPVIENCEFVCCSRIGTKTGNVFNGWGGGFVVRGCMVARCLCAAGTSFATNWGGSGNLVSAEAGNTLQFIGCVVSNCYTASASQHCYALASPGSTTLRFERCLFTNNLSRVKPVAGKCYSLLTAYYSEKKLALHECVLAGNRIEAPQVAAASGTYVLSMVGNYSTRLDTGLLNCSFADNTVSAAEVEGVTPVLCRGVAVAAYEAGAVVGSGIANCSFLGADDGTYDIVQYGSGHTTPLNVVNCVFTRAGGAQTSPVYSESPELVNLFSCSVQNYLAPPAGFNCVGLQTDKVPLASVPAPWSAAAGVLVPAAKMPGIRDAADIATNKLNVSEVSWNFRPAGSNDWQALSPAYAALTGSGFDSKLVGDAFGATRPARAFTRGASQALTPTAETGATLVLRRDPFNSGSFSGEAVQAVAKGTPTSPVTLAVDDPATGAFGGWFAEDDSLYSDNPTLSIAALSDDLTILTARIVTPTVELTFSLDGHGTFFSTGTDTATVEANASSPFPAVPAYTVDDAWHCFGFTLPETVPNADTTYTAGFVTKAVRIIHVVPAAEAPAIQDGASWATAYTNLAEAVADAAAYRGEVWVKVGTYLVTEKIPMRANVAVLGGFAGTETSAAEADPAANPTVITGDVNDNTFWRRNGSGNERTALKIWQNGQFLPPNPDGADDYWSPNGDYGEDTDYAFFCDNIVATNSVFDGLVFTCFQYGAMRAASASEGLVVRNCKFLACGTAASASDDCGVLNLIGANALVTNCLFLGCWRGVKVGGTVPSMTEVVDCHFTNGVSPSRGAALLSAAAGFATVRRCRFDANYCAAESYAPAPALAFKSDEGTMWNEAVDCVFANNRAWGQCHGTVVFAGGRGVLRRCLFSGNTLAKFTYDGTGSSFSACVSATASPNVVIRECLFENNSATCPNAGTVPAASVLSQANGYVQIFNCTIRGNAAESADPSSHVALLVKGGGSFAMANCLVDGSSIIGEAAHEIYATDANTLAIVNTVLRNEASGYSPFLFANESFAPAIANCVVSGYDEASLPPTGTSGYLYGNVDATDRLPREKMISEEVAMQGVGSARYAFGRPVWFVGNKLYMYDAVGKPRAPWRQIMVLANNYANGAVEGLSMETPPLADAAGAPRSLGKVAPGPLNTPAPTTILSVR